MFYFKKAHIKNTQIQIWNHLSWKMCLALCAKVAEALTFQYHFILYLAGVSLMKKTTSYMKDTPCN